MWGPIGTHAGVSGMLMDLEKFMEMHLVLGGPFAGTDPERFSTDKVKLVGIFANYDDALDAWRSASQRMIDDAEIRYMIVPLHRLIAPMLGESRPA